MTDIRRLESRSFFVPGRVDAAAVTFAMGPYDAKSSFDFHDNGREPECTSFRDDRQASGLSIFNAGEIPGLSVTTTIYRRRLLNVDLEVPGVARRVAALLSRQWLYRSSHTSFPRTARIISYISRREGLLPCRLSSRALMRDARVSAENLLKNLITEMPVRNAHGKMPIDTTTGRTACAKRADTETILRANRSCSVVVSTSVECSQSRRPPFCSAVSETRKLGGSLDSRSRFFERR